MEKITVEDAVLNIRKYWNLEEEKRFWISFVPPHWSEKTLENALKSNGFNSTAKNHKKEKE